MARPRPPAPVATSSAWPSCPSTTSVPPTLDVALGAGERQSLAERPTRNLTAYDAYLKGEELSKNVSEGDPPTLRRALVYYDQAIAIDSTFAVAWAERSRVYSLLYAN